MNSEECALVIIRDSVAVALTKAGNILIYFESNFADEHRDRFMSINFKLIII